MKLWYLLVVAVLWITGCSAPEDPHDQPPNGTGDMLTILAVYGDSLYGGEHFSLKVDRAGLTVSDLQLFVHTIQMQIDSVIDSTIYVTALPGEYGKVRLYYKDREARGEFFLYLYPADIDRHLSSMAVFWPVEGKIFDTIMIRLDTVYDDIDGLRPMVNHVPLEYVGPRQIGQTKGHGYRIPQGVKDGPLTIEMFGHRGSLGIFDLRHDDEQFYTEPTLSRIFTALYFPIDAEFITDNGDTSLTGGQEWYEVDVQLGKPVVTHTDSIRVDYQYSDNSVSRNIKFAMYYDSTRRTVSGWISYMRSGPSLELPSPSDTFHIAFKDIPWVKENHTYRLECTGNSVVTSLTDFFYQATNKQEGYIIRTTGFRPGDALDSPRMIITMTY